MLKITEHSGLRILAELSIWLTNSSFKKIEINTLFFSTLSFFFISFLFLTTNLSTSYSAENEKLYLAPPLEKSPEIYKYIFNQSGTLIAQSRNEGVESKSDRIIGKRINGVTQDGSLEDSLVILEKDGLPTKIWLTLKSKETKKVRVSVSIYNMLGNKVAELEEKEVSTNYREEIQIDEYTKPLSNGIYICVVQGINIRLKLYQKFTISR